MAWQQFTQYDQDYGGMRTLWYDTDTGNWTDTPPPVPAASAPAGLQSVFQGESGGGTQFYDPSPTVEFAQVPAAAVAAPSLADGIRQLYVQFQGREPDQSELDAWLQSGLTDLSQIAPYIAAPTAPAGPISLQGTFQGESGGGTEFSYVDPAGTVIPDQQAAATQYVEQLDNQLATVLQDPNATWFDKAQAIEDRHGIEAVAQLSQSGAFTPEQTAQLDPYIAARQREGEAEGFSIGGNQLGLLPVLLGTGAFAGLGAAGYGAESAAAGGTAAGSGAATTGGLTAAELEAAGLGAGELGASATGAGAAPLATSGGTAGTGLSALEAGAGGGFTGGFTGTSAGTPGFTGAAAGSPGLAAPAGGVTGAGALSSGFFAGETLAPVVGGAAATGATSLGANSGSSAGDSLAPTSGGGVAGTNGSPLSNLLGLDPNLVSVLGGLGAAGLGVYGANQQANALESIANKEDARIREMMGFGAPYRQRLSDLYSNPSAYLTSPEVTIPVQQGTNLLAEALSSKGNPAGSGAALKELQSYASNQLFGRLGQEKDRLGGFGGLTQYAGGAAGGPNLSPSMGAVNAQGGAYDAIGYGLGQITQPRRRSLQDLLSLT